MMKPIRIYGLKDPEPEPEHEFSSTQIQIIGKPAEIMRKMAADIPDADLHVEKGASYGGTSAEDGREHEPHVTVKWGLHFQSPTIRLRSALKDFGPVEIKFGKSSLFQNDDADVLKIDIDSPDLHRLNKLISRVVPTHETHPTYIPHATIAYLKKGRGKKYAGSAALDGQTMRFDAVKFSGRKGKIETLPLGHPAPAPYRVR